MKFLTTKKIALTAISLSLAGFAGAQSSSQGIDGAVRLDSAAIAAIHGRDRVPAMQAGPGNDDLPHPLEIERRALRQEALQQKLSNGSAKKNGKNAGKIYEVAKGQYVELEREGEDLIWTVLADFGDMETDRFPSPQLAGPARNTIPEPTPDNNTTIWRQDFSRDYYMDMLFNDSPGANSVRNFYKEQSSERYAVDGDVTDWASVPYNTAHYGFNSRDTWDFIDHSLNDWYDRQIANGKSAAEIDDYLSQFDVWDRYDFDGDGNFDEPDGYIDHFQSVHAGEGNEAGGGAYGDFAIWSHRWYAKFPDIGTTGPTDIGGAENLAGGVQVGSSKYWIGDYTVEPENGGVGVFAHEFAHDHGLPDLYNTGPGGSNSTGYWTLMSSGSWTSDGTVDIGSKPTHMGAWEKFQLGWLNYEVGSSGQKSEHKLGPAETNTKQAQALFVIAPDKQVIDVPFAYEGDKFYHSGTGSSLFNYMIIPGAIGGAGSTLTAKVNLAIETDWDYAYAFIVFDGDPNIYLIPTNLSTFTDPNGNNFFGLGMTGSTDGDWVELTADLSPYVGAAGVGFAYITDAFVDEFGFMADSIQVNDGPVYGAEVDEGLILAGFESIVGGVVTPYFNAFVAEFRQYRGYDEALETGPYVFVGPDTVDHFPYQDGLLISYWDSSQSDNNTATHPGEGLILPVDANPEPITYGGGNPFWATIQTYDSTFSLAPTDGFTLAGEYYLSKPGVSVFNANNDYYTQQAFPHHGVNPPKSDTQIRIKSVSAKGSFMQVEVR